MVDQGHDVTYLVSEEFRAKIEATGAKFESYEFDLTKPFTIKNTKSIYDAALKLAKDCDCIVYEMMFFLGKELGDRLNKPTVRLYSCFAWNREISQAVFNNSGFKLRLLGNRRFRKVAFSRALKQWNTKTNDVIDEITDNPADLNIVYTTREFQVQNKKFDDKLYKLEVLKRANLFITHGGMNSTSEAMFYGVPLVVVPQAADQPIVGNRILDLELGKVINKNEVSSEKLRKSAIEILSNSKYKENMDKMRDKMIEAGGEKAAVKAIEELINKK
ncbi:nucleotide disphospho-sugar-binding domain-containing protein [Clostridium sp. DJ247]|uniref:nucleotide disphospho-sugar-binding domain-containing protein n=1 Tax=Clostridium sp. DJ247 TaxID=2726188 RepID=UPI001A9ABDF7|nr:nucleotide disphospho-sugar-binding domain-containing protein [Clostridium sp. DJ247]